MSTKVLPSLLRSLVRHYGYDAVPTIPPDMSVEEQRILEAVRPYTMTSVARVLTLIRGVQYVVDQNLPGAFVECGVWRGGSMMAVAHTLLRNQQLRPLYLFDTFSGMPAPTQKDARFDGTSAAEILAHSPKTDGNWAIAGLDDVKRNLAATHYPQEHVHFVAGRVEETIPQQAPPTIATLRLDTDWYESTRHELHHLYPRVVPGGLVIIDDYGHWDGCRRAVDEFIATQRLKPFLHRIDYTGRAFSKPYE